MITPTLPFFVTCFLAYSSGANDNFKGVTMLFGSKTRALAIAGHGQCLLLELFVIFAAATSRVFRVAR